LTTAGFGVGTVCGFAATGGETGRTAGALVLGCATATGFGLGAVTFGAVTFGAAAGAFGAGSELTGAGFRGAGFRGAAVTAGTAG
jgi:hypothetical protein